MSMNCPKCLESRTKINKTKKNGTIQYYCKDCSSYFSVQSGRSRHVSPEPPIAPSKDSCTMKILDGGREAFIEANINAENRNPPTLEEIVERFELDLEEWDAESVLVNMWEMGYVANGKPGAYPIYQIKVRLIRKVVIEPSMPPVQPILISLDRGSRERAPRIKREKTGCALILSDPHFGYRWDTSTGKLQPFHDRHVWGTIFDLCKEYNFTDVIINGDAIDCTEFTDKFIRTPDFSNTLQPSLIELGWCMGKIRSILPNASMYFVEGNHEKRIPNHMAVHLGAAWGVKGVEGSYPALSVPGLLSLDSLSVEWVGSYPDNGVWLNENLLVTHGSKSNKNGSAKAMLDEARCSVVFGHVHRDEQASITRYMHDGSRTYYARCFGMVGNPNRTPGQKANQNHQQGFGVVNYFQDGYFELQGIPVYGKIAVYNGNKYMGKDYTKDLREETGWGVF